MTTETIICTHCGKEQELFFNESLSKQLKDREICHSCKYWFDIIDAYQKDDYKVAVVNGAVFAVCPRKDTNTKYNGFGGREFKIRFNDGKVIETNNLWNGSKIPENFASKLPNNAVFEDIETKIKKLDIPF